MNANATRHKYAVAINEHRYTTNNPEPALNAMAAGDVNGTILLAKSLPGLPKRCYDLGNGSFLPAPETKAN